MKKSLLFPLVLSASLNAGFIFEIGPSYRIDWQSQDSHIDHSPVPVPLFDDQDHYNNVSIWEIDAQASTDHCNPFYVGVESKYGWATTGTGRSVGLFLHGPSQFFENHGGHVTGHTLDLNLFAGYRLYFWRGCLSVIPCGGYEHHEKRFTQNNGLFNFNDITYAVTRTNNFFHVDHARGPFVGLEFESVNKCAFLVFGSIHWNWYLYTARSNVSFDQVLSTTLHTVNDFKSAVRSHITGPSAMFGMSYNVTKNAYVCLKSTYYYTYLMNGNQLNTVVTDTFTHTALTSEALLVTSLKLKNFYWQSWAIQFLVGYDF